MVNHTVANPSIIKRELKKFVTSLRDAEVLRLCRNGSIWLKVEPVSTDEVTQDDIYALGLAQDQNTIQLGVSNNLVLMSNFNGLADAFCEDYFDSEDDECYALPSLPKYNPDFGKLLLADCIESSFDSDFDSLVYRLLKKDAH